MLINKLYNAPAFRLFLVFSAGILIGKEIIFNPFVVLLLITVSLVYLIADKSIHQNSAQIILALVVVLSGIVRSNYDFYSVGKNSMLNLRYNHPGVFLTGIVSDLPEFTKNRLQFVLDAENITTTEDTLEITGSVLVTVKQTKEISDTINPVAPEAGDRVILYGDLADAPEDANPGEFNYRNYLRLNDIEKTFRVYYRDDIVITDRANLNFFQQNIILPARKYAIENINNYVGGNEGAFLNGLVTGYRSDIPKEIKEDFVKAGVMHILAVSGLNVAYVIIILSFILSMFRFGLIPKILLYIIALLFYTFFAGASASIIRAVIMGSLLLLVLIVQRKPNFYNVAGFSALIILSIDSRQLINPGFILTYASVLSIVFFMDRINYSFPSLTEDRKGARMIINKTLLLILSGLAAQVGVLPITIFYFSKVSIAGVFTNLIEIPLSNISLALGFVQIITGIASSYICELFAGANAMLLKFQLWFIHEAAAFRYSHFEFYGISFKAILVFYFALILTVSADGKRFFKAVIISAFVAAGVIVFSGTGDNNLRVTYLSVGNADCTHIETPDGSNILIDAGLENPFNHTCTQRVIPYLKYKRVNEIDLLIMTNDLEKNYYVLKNLTDNFPIKRAVIIPSPVLYSRTLNLLLSSGTDITNAGNVENIEGFGGVRIKIMKSGSDDKFLMRLVYGKNSFLFPGSPDKNDESEYISLMNGTLESDILKIASHGSGKSNSAEFLKAVNPSASVISCRNTYNNSIPSPEVLERLRKAGIRYFRTDTDNAIIFESDGETITTERD
ncbi:MAG: ComEC/Rec2 family competence protein [Bacteroidetes bacterium]|nr:ComEC/Rec2 family competence protein [Bacteroidota bacterium]